MSGLAAARGGRRGTWRALRADASMSAIVAGFLAVLVSNAGPLLVFLQSARAMGVSEAAFSGWVAAISAAAGAASIVLSLALRMPILIAWSAPGVVLLGIVGPGMAFSDVVGAYLVSAAVILVVGLSGLVERLLVLIPPSVAAGMMAGILFAYGAQALRGLATAPMPVAGMLALFVVLSAAAPRLALIWLLAAALAYAGLTAAPGGGVPRALPRLEATWPTFDAGAILGLALPLAITTLTGQFLAGLAILKANGFAPPARPILALSALVSIPAAAFGGITTALASITMALGAGEGAHRDPARRYVAGVASGGFFLLCAVFAGTIGWAMLRIPPELIALLAGLALLPAIGAGLGTVLAAGADLQAGMLTFVATASGLVLWDVGSAFWGLVIGVCAVHLSRVVRRHAGRSAP